ncbi:glycosyltransferase family 9 protein [Thermocrinis sp.]
MKVLVWQTAFLGDVVLATSLLGTLTKRFEKVGFVGRPFIKELLRGYKVELIPFNKGLWESFKLSHIIKDYDVVLSAHRSMRTALVLFFSGIPTRIGFDRSELPFLYTHRVPHRWGVHEVERNAELLRPLGIEPEKEELNPKLFVSEEEVKRAVDKFKLPENYVVFSPFSNFPLKEWHVDGWVELSSLLREKVVVIGTKRDEDRAKVFKEGVINLVGKTDLRELMAVISKAKLVISCDSSPVHIANALGVPALTIYTATSPAYGFYPLKGSYLIPNVECSPCSPNPKKCKTGTYECLSSVSVEKAIFLCQDLMTD